MCTSVSKDQLLLKYAVHKYVTYLYVLSMQISNVSGFFMHLFWTIVIFAIFLKDVCLPGWSLNKVNCRCYKFQSRAASWTQASKECQRIAPTNPRGVPPVTARHLAAPQNKQENDFVADLAGKCCHEDFELFEPSYRKNICNC